jgi:PAS domain S-box-containing protein
MSAKPTFDELEQRVRELEKECLELRHSKEALLRSGALFRDLVEKMPFPIAVGTSGLATVYMNPKFNEVFGYTAEDIPDQKTWRKKLMPDPEYRAKKSREVDQWIKTGESSAKFDRLFTDKSGYVHDIIVYTIRLEDRYYNVLEDITERKRADEKLRKAHDILEHRVEGRTADLIKANVQLKEEIRDRQRAEDALRESVALYRSSIELAPHGAMVIDPEYNILVFNSRLEQITGYSKADIPNGTAWLEKVYPDEEYRNLVIQERLAANNHETPRVRESTITRKDGRQRICQFTSTNLPNGLRIVFIKDISQEKQLEKQLIQSQKMEAIGTLAGGIAHDFNNLMTTIQGNVSLILSDTDGSYPHYEYLKNIEKQIESGSTLTSQLLGYAKKGKFRVRSIDLNRLVKETSNAFGRARKEISIQQELAEELSSIEVDQGQIEQVLLNLYVNSADAMPGGGDLVLQTRNVTHQDIKIRNYSPQKGKYVLLVVADSGEGMTKEIQERIFDPFFTTKDMGMGTGLGLASVYGIIKSHKGYINVKSARGKETTFYLYFPASGKKVSKQPAEAGEIFKGSGTVLLVDDEEMVLDVGVRLLQKLGYTVLQAGSGRTALKIYKKNKDLIDLVILDIIMPDMSGGEVFDRIKKIKPNVRVLLASGYSIDGQARDILNRGCEDFIQKPFSLMQLSQKISKIIV